MTDITGRMGKGGGSAPTEAPDNLVSDQTVRTLFAISEGYIDSVEQVYLDEVTFDNFPDSEYSTRLGYSSQTAIPEFIDTESQITPPSGEILKGTGASPIERTITVDYDKEAVRCTFNVTLQQVDDNGNVVGAQIEFRVYKKPNSSTPLANCTFQEIKKKGKSSKGYSFDVLVSRPETATPGVPWQITVTKITKDDTEQKKSRKLYWTAATGIVYKTLSYNNTALVGIVLKNAKQFGNRVPEVMFKVKGRKIRVPSNYNPSTRVYTGVWGGLFSAYLEYTNNPAWILYDILNDSRAGLGIPDYDIDKYAIYELGVYCDNLVNNLQGATPSQIPRYTFDYQFINRESPNTIISQILSICNANLVINEFGQISVIYLHAAQSVSRNVTCQNVIDGVFTYSSTDLEQRSNLVNVTYNNGLYFGRTDTATDSNNDLIARYGLQPIDIVLPGCYYQAQAIRKARSILYINSYFTNIINFSVLFEGLTYKIGDIIRVFDDYNAVDSKTGLITSIESVNGNAYYRFHFDRTIYLEGTGVFTFYIYDTDGVEHTATLSAYQDNTIDYVDILKWGGSPVSENSAFIITNGTSEGALYRVIKISKSDEQIYSISAVNYSTDLFTYIDSSIVVEPNTGDFVNLQSFAAPAPITNLAVVANSSSNGVLTSNKLMVDWEASSTRSVIYEVFWLGPDGVATTVRDIYGSNFEILNVIPGTYDITVYAVNSITKVKSSPVSTSYDYHVTSSQSSLVAPTNVRVTGKASTYPSTLVFDTQDLSISWDYNTANTLVADALYDYVVELYDSSGTSLQEVYSVAPIVRTAAQDPNAPTDDTALYIPLDGLFQLSYNENIAQFGEATRTFQLKIYSRDTVGNKSAPITVSCSNPVPSALASNKWSIIPSKESVIIDIQKPTDYDIAEYVIYKGTTPGFTKNDAAIVYAGPNTSNYLKVTADVEYYYAIGIADTFGRTGMLVSSEKSAIASAITATVDEYTYEGLTFTPNSPSANRVAWDSFNVYKNGLLLNAVSSGNALWSSGTLFLYFVPGNNTLQSNTSLVTAIQAGGRILASYKGGTTLYHEEGRAFTSGDMILAGTVGASQLVTNEAIITSSAQIGADIKSANYQATSPRDGWIIRQNGIAEFEGIAIYNGDTAILTAGNYTGTVNNVAASTITSAVTNFNNRNDRNASAIVNPSVVSNGTAVDHSINTDSSANISFEWVWSGTESDIDGFRVYVYRADSNSSYTFGANVLEETVFEVPASKRVFILNAVAANKYYTFGVQAYRVVDTDINASGLLVSSIAQSANSQEHPYQPSATVAFAGDVTGTIDGTSAATVKANAATALDNANAAQADADAALLVLDDIASDSKLTASEKQQTKLQWDAIVVEKPKLNLQASDYGITTENTSYNTAYTTLSNYITPLLSDLSTTSSIVGSDFRNNFNSYYTARQNLLNKISELAKDLSDAAQITADNAMGLLDNIASDSKFTPVEKSAARKEWEIIASEKPILENQATSYTITTEKSDYLAAFQALANYLNNGSTWSSGLPKWIGDVASDPVYNITTTESIDGPTFRTKWKDYYDKRTALQNAITAVVNAKADAASVDLSGKLNKAGTDVIQGTLSVDSTYLAGLKVGSITWNGSGVFTPGTKGVAITKDGIVGFDGSNTSFAINSNTGNAIFKGDLTGATGTFSGTVKVGDNPIVDQINKTMTGTGGVINPDGSFAFGNSSKNISFDTGNGLTLNGSSIVTNNNLSTNSVTTAKVAADQITETRFLTKTNTVTPIQYFGQVLDDVIGSTLIIPANPDRGKLVVQFSFWPKNNTFTGQWHVKLTSSSVTELGFDPTYGVGEFGTVYGGTNDSTYVFEGWDTTYGGDWYFQNPSSNVFGDQDFTGFWGYLNPTTSAIAIKMQARRSGTGTTGINGFAILVTEYKR